MKIIQINVVADRGSTGKICACIDAALNDGGYKSQVYYGRKSGAIKERRYHFGMEWEAALSKIVNRAGRLMYASSEIGTSRLIRRLRREKPDIVHLHCINGYCVDIYHLLRFLAIANFQTVVTHHAEFFYTANCGCSLDCSRFMENPGCGNCPKSKAATGAIFVDRSRISWLKMKDAFARFAPGKLIFTAVSPWVQQRSLLSPIVSDHQCIVVENGLDTTIFNNNGNRQDGRSLIPQCKDKLILHVTASFSDSPTSFKGGHYIVEMARRMPDVSFVVAASYSKIEGQLPENLYIHGRTKTQEELASLYRAADSTIITSRRETFSMVVAESLCCGTPVLGFKAGGPESIAIYPYCHFVEQGDIDSLVSALYSSFEKNFNRGKIAALAKDKFSAETMVENYLKIYSSFK